LAQHGIPCWIFTKPRNQDETFDGNSWITRVSTREEIEISRID
jgi:hypothetical protein